jgi:Abnormal spindle-like microcephaly-assoc'd, ASPM-SPD-2-Hydin/Flagellar-associated PapD-like
VDELPVYPVYETLDLKTVLFGRIYRKHLDLANRSKTACKVTIKIPPLFARYVSVNPQMLFVQAGTTQTVNLKFEPIPNIVKKLAYFSVPFPAFANAAALQIPIEVQMANQELPVFFILKTIVCQSTIDMSAESLDFGRVYVGQRNSLPLTVKNTSMLPQKVAFVRMKKEVTVQPYDGFATLLPNESVTFEVSFSPTSVVGYDFELTLLTSANDKCPVRITGHGIEPPVMLR